MTKCPLCWKMIRHESYQFKGLLEGIGLKDITIYSCDCPQIFPDNLQFAIEKDIRLKEFDQPELKEIKNCKRNWIKSHIKYGEQYGDQRFYEQVKYDNHLGFWGRCVNSSGGSDMIREAKDIEGRIRALLRRNYIKAETKTSTTVAHETIAEPDWSKPLPEYIENF